MEFNICILFMLSLRIHVDVMQFIQSLPLYDTVHSGLASISIYDRDGPVLTSIWRYNTIQSVLTSECRWDTVQSELTSKCRYDAVHFDVLVTQKVKASAAIIDLLCPEYHSLASQRSRRPFRFQPPVSMPLWKHPAQFLQVQFIDALHQN